MIQAAKKKVKKKKHNSLSDIYSNLTSKKNLTKNNRKIWIEWDEVLSIFL